MWTLLLIAALVLTANGQAFPCGGSDITYLIMNTPVDGSTIGAEPIVTPNSCIGGTYPTPDRGGVWHGFTGDGTTLIVDTCSTVSGGDTVLLLYSGSSPDSCNTCVDYNDDFTGCGFYSRVSVASEPGQFYAVVVTHLSGQHNYTIRLSRDDGTTGTDTEGTTTGGTTDASTECTLPTLDVGAVWTGGDHCRSFTNVIEDGESCTSIARNGYTCDTDTRVTCNAGAIEGYAAVTCTARATCPEYDGPVIADAVPPSCGTVSSDGDTCSVSCNAGYTATGQLVCENGAWSAPPRCKVASGSDCAFSPSPVANGQFPSCTIPTSPGGTCLLTCQDGYQKSGDYVCILNEWNSPQCTAPGATEAGSFEGGPTVGSASTVAPAVAAAVVAALAVLL